MTDIDLDAIRKRAEAATPATWRPSPHVEIHEPGYEVYRAPKDGGLYGSEGTVGWAESRADAEFIAHAREDVPALLAEVERLRTPGEPDLLDGITDADDLRGRVRAVMRTVRNVEKERDHWKRRWQERADESSRLRAQVQAVRAEVDGWRHLGHPDDRLEAIATILDTKEPS